MGFKFDSSMYAKVLKKRESKSALFDKVLSEIAEAEKNRKKVEYILFSNIHYNDLMNAMYLFEYSEISSCNKLMIFGIPCNFSNSVEKGFIVFYKKPQVDEASLKYIMNNKLVGTFYIEHADDIDELNNKAEHLMCDKNDIILVASGSLEGQYYVMSTDPICLSRIYNDQLRGLTKEEKVVWNDYNKYNTYSKFSIGYDYNNLRPSYSTFYSTSSTSNITTESSVSNSSGV